MGYTKSLQSCLTLCNPIDGSPPGSFIPGILQARILEWVAISFSNAYMHAKSLQSCPTLCDPMNRSTPGLPVHHHLTGDWNSKVGSQEIPGVTGKFGLGVRNEAGQRLTEFCQENSLVIASTLFQQHKRRLHMDMTRWSTLKSD